MHLENWIAKLIEEENLDNSFWGGGNFPVTLF
jgi:hypothetical protein